MGMENGIIRIQSVEDAVKADTDDARPYDQSQADLSKMGAYWMQTVHDNNYGSITSITPSHDNRFVMTCGADGNIFVFEMMSDEKIEEAKAVARAKIPSARVRHSFLISDVKGELHNRFNLLSEERVKFVEQNDEKLKEIGWNIRKLWHLKVSQNF